MAALGLAVAVALAGGAPATAQGKPTAASRKSAREHYDKAKAFQEAGRYAEAIAEYEQAHDAVPDPAFLYNIARCHHLAGERQRAIEAYEAYLAERPTGEIADEARSFAAELRSELATEKEEAARHAEEQEEAARARRLAPDQAVAAGRRDEEPRVDVEAEGERPAPRRSRARRVAWIAGGAALIGAGVLVDTLPDSGHNGTLEATDFVPVGLYLAGLAAVALGIF
jgi:tetratricopeptide (TPR) repeat protein